jgi:beta-galactosidase
LRIKAGDVSGYVTADGTRYGSDNYFVGGEGRGVNPPDTAPEQRVEVTDTDAPALYDSYRVGTFAYELPLADGEYVVTARFVESTESSVGQRVFDVVANGRVMLSGVDPFALAGGRLKAADQSFKVRAVNGELRIEFRPRRGDAAVVSALEAIRSDHQ